MGKRTKQYKKLMRAFELLGFRQPYQLLMTSDVILDTLKLDFITLLEKTLSTKGIKPMITQCCIRALYAKNAGPKRDPAVVAAIERAKTFERRRCGHLMDQDPLAERECMLSVVDPKGKKENKFRYVVVTQDEDLRDRLRHVVPTPLMYVKRSVVILEPMSSYSAQAKDKEERAKFMDGIIRQPQKRKRDDDDSDQEEGSGSEGEDDGDQAGPSGKASTDDKTKKKKKQYGRKGANPLAVKKKQNKAEGDQRPRKPAVPSGDGATENKAKRKRRKKTGAAEGGGGAEQATESGPSGQAETGAVEAAEA